MEELASVLLKEKDTEENSNASSRWSFGMLVLHGLALVYLLITNGGVAAITFVSVWFVIWVSIFINERGWLPVWAKKASKPDLITIELADGFVLVKQFDSVLWSARKSEISHVDLNLKKAKSKWLDSKTDLTIFTNNGDSYLLSGHRFDESQLLEFSALFEAKTS